MEKCHRLLFSKSLEWKRRKKGNSLKKRTGLSEGSRHLY